MSAKMALPPDLAAQNEELWRIVEKQRLVIQNLQKSLAIMTDERDTLLERTQELEQERRTPPPGGHSSGPVPPPRSPYRQNAGDSLGATIVEPFVPATYGFTSNNVSEAAHVYQGALANATNNSRDVVESVVTSLSPPPQGRNNNSNSYANTTTTTERQQQPSSLIDDYVKRQQQELTARKQLQQQEESARRAHEERMAREELKRQQQQMEEMMARRQQEVEEQARKAEETKRMEQMMARKQQEIEEQARRTEEIMRQQQEEILLRKQQREYEERRAAEEMKRQELRKHEARQQQQQQQEMYYTTTNEPYTDGSNSPSPTTPKNSTEYSFTPGPMAGVTVEVLSSYIFTNDKGKQVTAFNIAVRKPTDEANSQSPPEELWRIQKLYSDFLALDANLKSQDPSIEQLLAKFPDRALFSSRSPQKVDQGKLFMQEYLQQALRLPMVDVAVICEFLSSNVIDKSLYSKVSKYRQGYLTKRGKNFGGWKRRYFVLDGPELKYYESDDGQYLGSIHLIEAKIGKQKEPEQQCGRKDQQPSFKHAFLILEPKKSAPGGVARHVLCADSDADQDAWVESISQHIDPEAGKRNNGPATSSISSRKPNKNGGVVEEGSPEDALYAQLMQMANSAQDAASKKSGHPKKAFWPKKIFNSNSHGAGGNGNKAPQGHKEADPTGAKQVFGIPLEDAIRVARVSDQYELPAIVYRSIEFLEAKNAIEEEGIYRLSGSAAKIRSLKQRFNDEGDVDLLHVEDPYDIHTVSGLLKMWLRELPENVLTQELLKEFLNVMDLVERRERIQELGRLMSMLPLANYTLLRTLSAHLIRVVQNAGVNKMTMRNVGIVFSATLAMPTGIFHLLLTEFNYIFWTNQTQQQHQQQHQQQQRVPQQQLTTGRSNRNSVEYMYGAPKSIVGLERDGLPTAVEEEEDDLDEYEEDNKAGAKYPHQQRYY